MPKEIIDIYTDGSCKGNPGPGGWGAVLIYGDYEREISGGEPMTTNNRMEMIAVVRALQLIKKTLPIRIYTDSQYVSKGITEWLPNWQRSGFRKKDGKPVKNSDLWKELSELVQKHSVEWKWLKGHNGNISNERADTLASQAALKMQS